MKQIKKWILFVVAVIFLGFPVFAIELNSGNIQSLGCDPADKQCDLVNKWITKIATWAFSLYTGLRAIDLSGNNITELQDWMFSWLSHLSFLGLSHNQIWYVSTASFSGLNSLSILDLSNNKITSITIPMFSGLKALSTLYIWANIFSSVESWFASALSGVKLLLTAPEKEVKNETELDKAFSFAKKYELTSASSLSAFAPEKSITRAALAKILVLYMQNYKNIDTSTIKACANFSDISSKTTEDQEYIKQACEYKLMWREANQKTVAKKFNPNKEVTRAHFATILSRMLWGNQYNSTDKVNYYTKHINALKKEWILTNTNPQIIEARGFILLMLSRS